MALTPRPPNARQVRPAGRYAALTVPDIRRIPGTLDIAPPASRQWEHLIGRFAQVVEAAGYGLVVTPTFEDLAVFTRVGASTDVVRKEMYDFEDKGGRHLALRPEFTASVVRAYLDQHPTLPWKTWYVGSAFRYEKSQAGRYREFHQVGIEAIGSADPDLDVEVVALGWEFYRSLGLERVELELNSLGDGECRPAYRAMLLEYLHSHRDELCEEHRDRIEENPLRVLDCKKPACRKVVAGAPRQLDHLCEACAAHFARVRAGLDALGVPYRIDTTLVRGLDYYTRTTFQYVGLAVNASNNELGGGGRYDGLVAELGGPPTPGIGFALGVERILIGIEAEGAKVGADAALDVFVVDLTDGQAARDVTATLRAAAIRCDRSFDGRSARAQFKAADRSGARWAVVVGPDELAAGTVGLKELLGTSEQISVARSEMVSELRRRLA